MAKNLKEMVYSSIIADIANGVYKPNEILNERVLIEKYKCSKSPVREALILLCQNNVLRNIPRCGYEVVHITQEEVEQLLQLRYLLEAGMVEISIQRLTERDLETLENLNSRLCFGENDIWEYWDWNANFHLELVHISGNAYAYQETKLVCDKLKLAYAQMSKEKWSARSIPYTPETHNKIIRSLRQHDITGARSALRDDLMHFSHLDTSIPDFFSDSK